MYKILLCCASGITTNMLVNSIKKEAMDKGVSVMCWAVAETAVELSWADADVVLVAPQSKGDLANIENMINGVIPCDAIDGVDFSKMDGRAVLEQAIKLIDNNK